MGLTDILSECIIELEEYGKRYSYEFKDNGFKVYYCGILTRAYYNFFVAMGKDGSGSGEVNKVKMEALANKVVGEFIEGLED